MTHFMRLTYASFLVFAVSALLAPLQARANFGNTQTPALRVSVEGQPTKFMSVYFARGRAPLIGIGSKQIKLTDIKAKVRVALSGQPVVIPAQSVTRTGVLSAYNYLVLAFHNQEQFVWINADDSLPDNESQNGTPEARKLIVLDALEINQLPIDGDGNKRIQVDGF